MLAENIRDVSAEMIQQLAKNLRVSLSRGPSADTLEISITSTDSDLRRAARVVDALARQYALGQNAKLAFLAEQRCRDARDAAEAAVALRPYVLHLEKESGDVARRGLEVAARLGIGEVGPVAARMLRDPKQTADRKSVV